MNVEPPDITGRSQPSTSSTPPAPPAFGARGDLRLDGVAAALRRGDERRARLEFDRLLEEGSVWKRFAERFRRMGLRPEEAEDLIPEAGRRLWQAASRGAAAAAAAGEPEQGGPRGGITNLAGYADAVARSVAADYLRRKHGVRRVLTHLEALVPAGAEPPGAGFCRWTLGGAEWAGHRSWFGKAGDPAALTPWLRERIRLEWEEAPANAAREGATAGGTGAKMNALLIACFRNAGGPLPYSAVRSLALELMEAGLPPLEAMESLDAPHPETGTALKELLPDRRDGTEERVVRSGSFAPLRDGVRSLFDRLKPAAQFALLLAMEPEAAECLFPGEDLVEVVAAALAAARQWPLEEARGKARELVAGMPLPDATTAQCLGVPVNPHLHVLRLRAREKFRSSPLERMRQDWLSAT